VTPVTAPQEAVEGLGRKGHIVTDPSNGDPNSQGTPNPGFWQKQPPPGQPPEGPPPGYPPPRGYPGPGYGPQGYPAQGYPPSGYGAPGYPPSGYGAPGYPPSGYAAPGYPPAGYGPAGYPSPGYGAQSGYGPPPSHLGWAIVAIVFFWPLAIAAFINYGRIESSWYRGDSAGAQRASDNVKKYGVIALVIGIALFVLWIVLAATVFSTVACLNSTNC
jgi:hypothetical protein